MAGVRPTLAPQPESWRARQPALLLFEELHAFALFEQEGCVLGGNLGEGRSLATYPVSHESVLLQKVRPACLQIELEMICILARLRAEIVRSWFQSDNEVAFVLVHPDPNAIRRDLVLNAAAFVRRSEDIDQRFAGWRGGLDRRLAFHAPGGMIHVWAAQLTMSSKGAYACERDERRKCSFHGGVLPLSRWAHYRLRADASRIRAANSMTASTCSRSRPSNHSMMSSMLAPAAKLSKITETGMRVPLSTQAPLTLPGMLSTAGHCDQSSAGMKRLLYSMVHPLDACRRPECAARRAVASMGRI